MKPNWVVKDMEMFLVVEHFSSVRESHWGQSCGREGPWMDILRGLFLKPWKWRLDYISFPGWWRYQSHGITAKENCIRKWNKPGKEKYVTTNKVGRMKISKPFDISYEAPRFGICLVDFQYCFGLIMVLFLPFKSVLHILWQCLLKIWNLYFFGFYFIFIIINL